MNPRWKYQKLGDLCIVERGGSPRPIEAYITDRPDGINWIKIGDADASMFITRTAQRIRPEGMKKSRYVQPGDFLLSNSMSFGRPYILKIDGCIHDGWLVLRDKNKVFDKRFLYYYLSSPTTYQKFQSMAVGGVVNNLNSAMVRNVDVPVPSIAEQKQIADLLDRVSLLQNKRNQQLFALDTLVKSRFVEMFGDPLRSSSAKRKLSDIGKIQTGSTPPTSNATYYAGNDIPFVKPGDLTDNGAPTIATTTTSLAESARAVVRIIPPGAVLVTCIGIIGKIGIAAKECCCNQQINFVIPGPEINSTFLAHCLLFFKQRMTHMANAPVVPILNKTQFSSLQIPVPPLALQNQFASFVSRVERAKTTIHQALSETQTLFDSLMQEYFG